MKPGRHVGTAAMAGLLRPSSGGTEILNAAFATRRPREERFLLNRCVGRSIVLLAVCSLLGADGVHLRVASPHGSSTAAVEDKHSIDVHGSGSAVATKHKDIVDDHIGKANNTERGSDQSGRHSAHSVSKNGYLGFENGTVTNFTSCDKACDTCFNEHYQGCLAFCRVGCEDYCEKQLPRPSCTSREEWVAQVGHVFEALNPAARMCKTTGVDGCPKRASSAATPTPVPFDPYTATETNGEPVVVGHRLENGGSDTHGAYKQRSGADR
mmetsp:Transcript_122757/g.354851  ORF Transcript_122757/g.354851 Transcript_122757/m.354851 type:complete len:268 (-) Transcript_122757:126-929(-)